MSEETQNVETTENVDTVESVEAAESVQPAEQSINIGVEQILASILETLGSVVVPIETILKNYGEFAVAVDQDEETKALTFRLTEKQVDNNEDAQAE
jgi:hypothetical protein